MQVASLVLGILAIAGLLLGMIPCIGWYNWFNIPFSVVGIIVSAIAMTKALPGKKGMAVGGLVMCIVAVIFGGVRLIMGAGVV